MFVMVILRNRSLLKILYIFVILPPALLATLSLKQYLQSFCLFSRKFNSQIEVSKINFYYNE